VKGVIGVIEGSVEAPEKAFGAEERRRDLPAGIATPSGSAKKTSSPRQLPSPRQLALRVRAAQPGFLQLKA